MILLINRPKGKKMNKVVYTKSIEGGFQSFKGRLIKQQVASCDGMAHLHCNANAALMIWLSSKMNGGPVSSVEIAVTSLFGGSNSRCEIWWVSHSSQRPNQTGNPPLENSSLLCLSLPLLHSKHCCNT